LNENVVEVETTHICTTLEEFFYVLSQKLVFFTDFHVKLKFLFGTTSLVIFEVIVNGHL